MGSSPDQLKSVLELQWAHATLIRLIDSVQRHALVGEAQNTCIARLADTAVLLEGLIHDHNVLLRRSRDVG